MSNFKILGTVPGNYTVSNHSLSNKHILKVVRSGLGYDLYLGLIHTPVNREVRYINYIGSFSFDQTIPFNPGEKVYVEYE